jgi:hypothetical protein
MTEEERALLDLTVKFTNQFRQLPEHHPSDIDEMVLHVHALQHLVMKRLAIRQHPDYFTPMERRR